MEANIYTNWGWNLRDSTYISEGISGFTTCNEDNNLALLSIDRAVYIFRDDL